MLWQPWRSKQVCLRSQESSTEGDIWAMVLFIGIFFLDLVPSGHIREHMTQPQPVRALHSLGPPSGWLVQGVGTCYTWSNAMLSSDIWNVSRGTKRQHGSWAIFWEDPREKVLQLRALSEGLEQTDLSPSWSLDKLLPFRFCELAQLPSPRSSPRHPHFFHELARVGFNFTKRRKSNFNWRVSWHSSALVEV